MCILPVGTGDYVFLLKQIELFNVSARPCVCTHPQHCPAGVQHLYTPWSRDWLSCVMACQYTNQTESIRAKGTSSLNCNWDKMVRPGQSSVPLFLASAVVATALASLVASDMYEAA